MILGAYYQKPIPYIIFLPAILLLGLMTSYEDIKISRIRNKWVIGGILYSLAIYLLSFILHYLADLFNLQPLGIATSWLLWNLDKWLINLLISTLVAYFLWLFKMWGAGDAKLFIAFVALVPIGQYSRAYFEYYFASFSLLMAIFIPSAAFLLAKVLLYNFKKIWSRRNSDYIARMYVKVSRINKYRIFKSVMGFFAIFLLIKIINQAIYFLGSKFILNVNIVMLISFILFRKLSKIFRNNSRLILFIFVPLLLCIISFKLYAKAYFVIEMVRLLIRAGLMVLLFPLLKTLVKAYGNMVQGKIPFAMWIFIGVLIIWLF